MSTRVTHNRSIHACKDNAEGMLQQHYTVVLLLQCLLFHNYHDSCLLLISDLGLISFAVL